MTDSDTMKDEWISRVYHKRFAANAELTSGAGDGIDFQVDPGFYDVILYSASIRYDTNALRTMGELVIDGLEMDNGMNPVVIDQMSDTKFKHYYGERHIARGAKHHLFHKK